MINHSRLNLISPRRGSRRWKRLKQFLREARHLNGFAAYDAGTRAWSLHVAEAHRNEALTRSLLAEGIRLEKISYIGGIP